MQSDQIVLVRSILSHSASEFFLHAKDFYTIKSYMKSETTLDLLNTSAISNNFIRQFHIYSHSKVSAMSDQLSVVLTVYMPA